MRVARSCVPLFHLASISDWTRSTHEKEPCMNHQSNETGMQPDSTEASCVPCRGVTASVLSPVEHGWKPVRLPELATNGFPFSPTFILPKNTSVPSPDALSRPPISPFGFHYWQPGAVRNRPVIDLTKGHYDPHTQTYTIPLLAGGDTDGGVIPTGEWTDRTDGRNPGKEWDVSDDKVTD